MKKFDNLNIDAKMVYLLLLTEFVIDKTSQSEGYEIALDSLNKAWDWIKYKNIDAYSLYLYLENMDETDIMTYMELEEDPGLETAWICIGDALAYIIREAYLYEKEKYLPQTIESVDDETVESFIANFKKIYNHCDVANQLLDYLEHNYPKNSTKKVDIDSVKAVIKDVIH